MEHDQASGLMPPPPAPPRPSWDAIELRTKNRAYAMLEAIHDILETLASLPAQPEAAAQFASAKAAGLAYVNGACHYFRQRGSSAAVAARAPAPAEAPANPVAVANQHIHRVMHRFSQQLRALRSAAGVPAVVGQYEHTLQRLLGQITAVFAARRTRDAAHLGPPELSMPDQGSSNPVWVHFQSDENILQVRAVDRPMGGEGGDGGDGGTPGGSGAAAPQAGRDRTVYRDEAGQECEYYVKVPPVDNANPPLQGIPPGRDG